MMLFLSTLSVVRQFPLRGERTWGFHVITRFVHHFLSFLIPLAFAGGEGELIPPKSDPLAGPLPRRPPP
jgi:hypothetical protein